jgi:hypothetical protein
LSPTQFIWVTVKQIALNVKQSWIGHLYGA